MNTAATSTAQPPFPPFRTVSDLLRENARQRPQASALADDDIALNWAQLDALVDRVAASLQRAGLQKGDVVAVCAAASVRYAAVYLGALRCGVVVAPLAPSVTPDAMQSMLRDAEARMLFVDAQGRAVLPPATPNAPVLVSLDDDGPAPRWHEWLAPEGAVPQPVAVAPEHPFNIIYSSGTTGTPKGIVQSHGMRWAHIVRGMAQGYGPDSVTLLATPLYSNTTLVSFFPGLCGGGSVRLMPKFDALRYLQIAQQIRATHSMLVPVQYQRIMALPQFGTFDLSSFRAKFCTSAPFRAELKADVLDRKSTRLNSSHSQISHAAFFFNDTATTEIYTLSLHDALPICSARSTCRRSAPSSAPARRSAPSSRPTC